ncbi:MAG TPA: transporter [Candidatus Paceibacterota bacterium]|nr:transporter [Verrucomicrobiota bacterium]HSA09126.1 transporter [Candidatus Paceibacterota bacterium]
MKQKVLIAGIACTLAMTAVTAHAEEGGSAHYMPGSTASFIDAFPGKPGGIAVLDFFTYYEASAPVNRQLPLGGLLTAGIDATVYANTVVAVYQTPWSVLGGGLAAGVALPYVWLEVKGEAQRTGPGGQPGTRFTAKDTADGFGDMTIYPFMLGWTNIAPDLKLDLRLGIYAPTGDYEQGRLANVGKNYWSFEPGIMASWFSSKIGTEVSLYTGVDFNTENGDTDYTSGTSLHMDLTVAQHLPLFGGLAGVGGNAFYYQQLTGDSGPGARLGDFEGMTCGIGPVISYVRPLGRDTTLLAEIKWLPELDTDKRLEGDYVWVKLGILF